MHDFSRKATELWRLGRNITNVYARRVLAAEKALSTSIQTEAIKTLSAAPWGELRGGWQDWPNYATDVVQRSVLFWDTLRQRGNNYLEHERAGKPPLLDYDYEIVEDGRTYKRPVNYALVRIIPPEGIDVDETKRPFVIVDPRAGHGPGIGGFKQDSQVGVVLKAGHPVYFVIFFARPEAGQTLSDVCDAEARFVEVVAERHPGSPKPALIGNCQGGWATMLLAAARPNLTGPVVINGAPMSYWSGSWHGGEGENPMRYLGGLMGGAWVALLTSDLGNGLIDGAHFVANFERLNPANTLWSKYYHLFANVDNEPPRFLGFEKWWGGYFLMNEAELRWILDNLFVGNRLARGEAKGATHSFIDLKAIRSPIIVFSSAGDNITPPQQALNWIADAYSSTEEIKANGQVIVGLLHEDIGHLGIFVSGRVAKKQHAQIVEVLKYIESLRPGLYVMEIHEEKGRGGKVEYEVSIEERRLEDLRRLNKLERKDEKPFEVVADVSDVSDKLYSLFVRPFVKPFVTEVAAEIGRMFHPLRVQRWTISDLNPMCWSLPAMASTVKTNRIAAAKDNPLHQLEKLASVSITATLDLYRDLRDAVMEAVFFQVYGSAAVWRTRDDAGPEAPREGRDPRELTIVQNALDAIGTGGYPEAVALIGALVGRGAGPIPLSRLELVDRFVRDDDVLSRLPSDEIHRIKAEQAVVAELEPEKGLRSLPKLLANPKDRKKALAVLDKAVELVELTSEQIEMLERVQEVLGGGAASSSRAKPDGTASRPSARRRNGHPTERNSSGMIGQT
jgi:pimeloyl-ACP methyl ester carboxylesterase